jgi:arylsulfatase A
MRELSRRDFLKYASAGTSSIMLPGLFSDQNSSKDRPNIILIMADDLGYECLGCYGGQSYRTPVLDNLAGTGVRFDYCYSQPLCTPSRVQIMTGRYNFRNYKMFGYLDPAEITFGHVLKNAGYATCISGKWQLGNGIEGPFHAGFEEYCLWQIYSQIARKDVRGPRYANPRLHVNGKVLEGTRGKYGPDICCDFILDFMDRKRKQPFFIYYPMILTHDPFVPTPDSAEWKTRKNKPSVRFFSDMVSYMDKIVGRIAKNPEKLGLREKTLILFTTDNGTGRKIKSRQNGRWIQGGKSFTTEAGTHVPFIASWPGRIPEGIVNQDLVDFSDFLPTLAEISGTTLPENVVIDGQSFYPQLLGKKGNPREWVYIHYWGRGRHILLTQRCAFNKRWKLYDDSRFIDIQDDPLEQNPLAPNRITGDLVSVKNKLQAVLDSMK